MYIYKVCFVSNCYSHDQDVHLLHDIHKHLSGLLNQNKLPVCLAIYIGRNNLYMQFLSFHSFYYFNYLQKLLTVYIVPNHSIANTSV